ncbi:ABC transporter ATP-binding protein [Bifidobacterium jacchi]|nr:ABC transporter ATP-binding protein [Bifidobacterium jacchi]
MQNHDKTSTSTWRIYRWLLSVCGRAMWLVVALCLIQAAMAAIGVGYALMMRAAIDAAVARDQTRFVREAVLFAGAIIVQIVLRAAGVIVAERARSSMDNRLRAHVFAGVLEAPIAQSQRYHSGELMNRLMSDVTVVSGAVTSLIPSAAAMAVRVVGVVAVMIAIAPTLTAVLVAGGVLMVIVSLPLRGLLKRLHKRVQEAGGRVQSFMQESIEGLLVIQSFGVGGKIVRIADSLMDAHRSERMHRVRVSAFASTGLATAMNLGYLIGFVWSGFGILNGTITYGTMMAVIQLIGQIQSPFAMIGGMFPQHAAMLASTERLMDLVHVTANKVQAEAGLGVAAAGVGEDAAADADAGDGGRFDSAVDLYDSMLAIRFDRVDFTYGRNEVLRRFSADIHCGDIVAITGRSGVGKSTMLKLLLGVYEPQSGRVGVQISDDASSLDGLLSDRVPDASSFVAVHAIPRGFFAYVPQGNALMSGTIREVVAFAEPDPDPACIDDDLVRRSCRIAGAAEFIEKLPDGYDTMLGEHGSGLSEGQMQRIAIARALYSRAPVLLLDESTSALDERTEHVLLEHIRALRNRTVLIVTHRPEVLAYCDAVIRLGDR